ncbi:MAG: NrfD/PsrC family molybdoenzyme membrane anchor subunit [Candidatus Heimdallarchaeota archaeon]
MSKEGEQSVFGDRKTSMEILYRPITETSRSYFLFLGFLLFVIGLGAIAYIWQLLNGLVVTGMRDRVSWSVYITNFVFFIGVSHAGTFISAVLRASDAEWRYSITRMAEMITGIGLLIGGAMVLIDLGRIDRIHHLLLEPRIRSPIFWDFMAISMYIIGSLLYLYLALIPDFAMLRDRLGDNSIFLKRWMWTILALGWQGTEDQKKWLHRGMAVMVWILIPVMVSVHTVVSFAVGGVHLRPGWRSTVFGIYFVVGALYSGIALLIVIMWIFREVYPDMKVLITPRQFRNLGIMLLILILGYGYLTLSEYMNAAYTRPKDDFELLEELLVGDYAALFWLGIMTAIVIPLCIIAVTRARSIRWLVVASVIINIGMWLKRYIIIIPSMARPWVAGPWAPYSPTIFEVLITLGAFAALAFGFAVGIKFFPVAPLWEILEDEERRKKMFKAGIEPQQSFADYSFPMKASDIEMERKLEKELMSG